MQDSWSGTSLKSVQILLLLFAPAELLAHGGVDARSQPISLEKDSSTAPRTAFSINSVGTPQLFACVALREHQQRKSFRRIETLLSDSPAWLADSDIVAECQYFWASPCL